MQFLSNLHWISVHAYILSLTPYSGGPISVLASDIGFDFSSPWSRFPARSLSKSTGNENDSDGLPACQRLRRRLVPCGEALWPQPLPSSQAPAGKTIGGLAAQFLASGLSSSCPCLKKTICRAQHFLENPYLCTRLRSHKMELSVTLEAESPILSASNFL